MTRKRQLIPVVLPRMQIAEGLARNLERLGLERRAREDDVARPVRLELIRER